MATKRDISDHNSAERNGELATSSTHCSTVPRSYSRIHRPRSNGHQKADNFFIRLMRHFSSNSIHYSSHHNCHSTSNGYLTMTRASGESGGKQQPLPSSVSNGDIRQCQQTIGVPAVTGIKNHGNTCFMNAVLQCLSNTDLFAEFFVLNHYKSDLSKRNKLHAKKYGTRGEVTEQLAALLKSLWSNQYSPEISYKFKQLVAKYGPQYDGNDQHDAQEFLLWLLDKIHEDLNIATKKKYKKFKNMYNHNRPDELIAAETLANHMRCNSSFIHDLFQAQLRSSLVCRSCGNSNTFDPYLCLSLPVPVRQTHTIIVNVTYLKKSPREVKIGVSIEAQASLRELRDKISRLIKVPERQLVLLMKNDEIGLKELTKDTEVIIDILDDMQEIDAIETLPVQQPSHLVIDSSSSPSPSPTAQLLILIWSNYVKIGSEGKLFGPLFTCQVSREAPYKQIQSEILNTMKTIIRKDIDLNLTIESSAFRLRVVLGTTEKYFLPEDVDHPLYMPEIDKALLSYLFLSDDEMPSPVIDSNIEYVKARTQKANRASLSDCFDMYFREEKLAGDNAWICPVCKRRQQCIKKLSLWSVPEVFIVHLKRFRQASSTQRNKLSTLVVFPISGLDMNPYLVPKVRLNHSHQSQAKSISPINGSHCSSATLPTSFSMQKSRIHKISRSEDNIYDLYAVCNHNGNMQSGHYTAYCKNPVDGKWYFFDDTKVTPVPEDTVVTADAYILFYQRRCFLSSLSSASSSTSGYSSCASSCYYSTEHWAFKMPSSSCSSPKSSHSQEQLSETCKGQNNGTPKPNRCHKNYASLPSKAAQQKQLQLWPLKESNSGAKEVTSSSSEGLNKSPPTTVATSANLVDSNKSNDASSSDTKSENNDENNLDKPENTKKANGNVVKPEKSYTDSLTKKYWTVTSV
ncbi:ubiquitin specific protease-like protein [Dinothrombium tinctorium]|uniref:Ubiquitin carboxyl-terminal hydrolase n=1 Tax=Dinothrombium tinctorium TaxID=1965070 RepID=A0A3S3P4Y5_9ACAR|nr:ubiquitin specific protease-like protein [Dinothrombium tinctorium]RWS15014.1 ubiquitin specific protease-like protein [Dinothrombium tinctorium]